MEKINLTLKKETIELMKTIKLTHSYKTYDVLIVSAIKILSNSEITGEKSKADILLQNDVEIKKRMEQLFKLIGAHEKMYFKKILDFPYLISEQEMRVSNKIETLKPSVNFDEKVITPVIDSTKEIKINPFENEILELKKIIREDSEKLELLKNKFNKSTGFLKTSNYEASITEEEFNNLFD